jgi:hypothetical protein
MQQRAPLVGKSAPGKRDAYEIGRREPRIPYSWSWMSSTLPTAPAHPNQRTVSGNSKPRGWPASHALTSSKKPDLVKLNNQTNTTGKKNEERPRPPLAERMNLTQRQSGTQFWEGLAGAGRTTAVVIDREDDAPVCESKQPPGQSCSRPTTSVPPDGMDLPLARVTDHTGRPLS